MITATVRYKLPAHIDKEACRAHFHKRVYQWRSMEDAKAFYSGPWLAGIVERYGMPPQIDYYEVFAITDNVHGTLERFQSDPVIIESSIGASP